jgi:hypothetical protein
MFVHEIQSLRFLKPKFNSTFKIAKLIMVGVGHSSANVLGIAIEI